MNVAFLLHLKSPTLTRRVGDDILGFHFSRVSLQIFRLRELRFYSLESFRELSLLCLRFSHLKDPAQ